MENGTGPAPPEAALCARAAYGTASGGAGNDRFGTLGVMAGFLLMMALDAVLGWADRKTDQNWK